MVVSLEAIGIKSDKPLYNNRKQTINKQIDSVTPPEHTQHQTRNRKTRKISIIYNKDVPKKKEGAYLRA